MAALAADGVVKRGDPWRALEAEVHRRAELAAEAAAARLAARLARDVPDVAVRRVGADIDLRGRGLLRRFAEDVRLRWMGRG